MSFIEITIVTGKTYKYIEKDKKKEKGTIKLIRAMRKKSMERNKEPFDLQT